jgi:hypothetical protein
MQSDNTFTFRDTSSGKDNTYLGNSIQIVLPPKPGDEGPDYNNGNISNQGESRMDVCALTLSCLAQDPNLPSSKLPFAWKLYEMLETVHKNEIDTDIVSWVDNGKAFKVHNLKRFVDEIVPTYFKQSKYKSFQRQLYFYGFIREAASGKEGHTPGSYRHPRFVRGQKSLCLSMVPKKSKKRSGSKSPIMGVPAKMTSPSEENQDSVATSQPNVVREISSEIDISKNSNIMTPFQMHNVNAAFGTANIVSQDTDSNNAQHGDAFEYMNPQMQFRQQQNQLQRLQIEGFLRSIQHTQPKNLVRPQRPEAPPAPSLYPSVSDGNECNLFGGSFHVVGRKRSL